MLHKKSGRGGASIRSHVTKFIRICLHGQWVKERVWVTKGQCNIQGSAVQDLLEIRLKNNIMWSEGSMIVSDHGN